MIGHKGNPNTHRHSAYGADTSKNLSIPSMKLTPEQIESLKKFNKDITGLIQIVHLDYFDKYLKDNYKYPENLSYAILVILLSNAEKIKELPDYDKDDLYKLLKFLDIPESTFMTLVKLFKLENFYNLEREYHKMLTSPHFNRYYTEISQYMNTSLFKYSNTGRLSNELIKCKAIGSVYPLTENYGIRLLNEYKSIEDAFQKFKKDGLINDLKRGDYDSFVSKFIKIKVPLFGYYDIQRFISPYFLMALEYYTGKPLEEIPPGIVFFLSILPHELRRKSNTYIFLSKHSIITKKLITSKIFNEFIKEVSRGLESPKSFFDMLLTISLNEAKFLSKSLTKQEIEEMKNRIESIGKKNEAYIKEPYKKHPEWFKHRIDYLTIMFPMRQEQTSTFKELVYYINDLKKEGINTLSDKDLFTIKWLTYNPNF